MFRVSFMFLGMVSVDGSLGLGLELIAYFIQRNALAASSKWRQLHVHG